MLLDTLAIKLTGDTADFVGKMNSAANAVTAVGDKMQATGDRMQAIGQKWSLYVSAPLIAMGKSALDSAADFEQSMNVMEQVTGATTEQMKALSDQALKLGKDTVFGAGEAAEAQLTLAKAGFEVGQVLDATTGVINLAAAANMDLATAADVTASAVNAYRLEAKDAGRISDLLAAAANNSTAEVSDMALGLQMSSAVMAQYGFTVEETVTILAQLANAGIKSSDAGTSLKVAAMRLAAPTKEAAAAMATLGISIYDADGAMRSSREILEQFIDKLGPAAQITNHYGGATEKMAKAAASAEQKILPLTNRLEEQQSKLGILQQELTAVIEKYGEGSTQVQNKRLAIEKLTNQIEENQAKLTEATDIVDRYDQAVTSATSVTSALTEEQRNQALQTIFGTDGIRVMNVLMADGIDKHLAMADAITEQGMSQELANARMKGLSGAIEYFKGTLDSLMIETALPWLETLSDIIRKTADWIAKFGELDPVIQKNIVIFAALAAAIGPVLIYGGLLVSSIGSIISAFGALSAFLMANPVVALAALAAALVTFMAAWDGNWGGIREKTQAAITYIREKFDELVAYLRDSLPGWMTSLQEWGKASWQWLAEATPVALAKLGEWTVALVRWVADKLPDWIATLFRWGTALVSWIGESLPAALDALSDWIYEFVGWGKSEKSELVEMVNGFRDALIDWISHDLIPTVWPEMVKFGDAIHDALGKIMVSIGRAALLIGSAIIQGIVDGIKGGWNALMDAAKAAAQGALDAAKAALGIASPSRAFTEIGRDSMLGWAEGIDIYAPEVLDTLSKYLTATIKTGGDWANDWVTHLPSNLQDTAKTVGQYIAAVIETGGDWANDWLSHLPSGETKDLTRTIGRYLAATLQSGDWLNDWLSHLPESMRGSIQAIGQRLGNNSAPITSVVQATSNSTATTVATRNEGSDIYGTETMGALGKYLRAIVTTGGDWLNDWVTHLPTSSRDTAKTVGKYIASILETGGDWLNDWLSHLPQGEIKDITRDMGRYLATVMETGDWLNDWLTHLPESMRSAVRDIGQLLGDSSTLTNLAELVASINAMPYNQRVATTTGLSAEVRSALQRDYRIFEDGSIALRSAQPNWNSGQITINLPLTVPAGVDARQVTVAARDGILQGLRQVGLA